MSIPAQTEERSRVSQRVGAEYKAWVMPAVWTLVGVLLAAALAWVGILLDGRLAAIQSSIEGLRQDVREDNRDVRDSVNSLREEVRKNGERLAHIEGRLGIRSDPPAQGPSGGASAAN